MSFTISSSNATFNQKQKDLFDQLDIAAKNNKRNLPENEEMETDHPQDYKRQRHTTKHFKRQESIFKRPEAPISKCLPLGRIPDFRKNPDKWTKYDLKDVEDVSDRSNTNAALTFLKELEQRKVDATEAAGSTDDSPKKIVFKKSVLIKKDGEENVKATFKSSKVVMPEYVVGEKVKKEKKNRKIQAETSNKQLKLDHLLDDDEDS